MKISCLGGVTADNYVDRNKILAGGCGLNNAVHLKKLKPNYYISVVGEIGKDEFGDSLMRYLFRNSINMSHLRRTNGQTSVQHIRNTESGEKIFSNYEAGVIATMKPSQSDYNFLAKQDAIIGSMFSQIEPYLQSVITKKISGDTIIDFRDLKDYGKSVDIVKKYIDNFTIGFFGLSKSDKKTINDLAQIARLHKKLIVITLGENGAIAFSNSEKYIQKVQIVDNPLDTTGAGDAFLSAFLSEYYTTRSIQSSLQHGCDYASQVIQIIGAN